jgi:hypothetical protein
MPGRTSSGRACPSVIAGSQALGRSRSGELPDCGPSPVVEPDGRDSFRASQGAPVVCFDHSSVRAAMIYQHATRDRDQAIAKALGGLVREVREARSDQAERTEA